MFIRKEAQCPPQGAGTLASPTPHLPYIGNRGPQPPLCTPVGLSQGLGLQTGGSQEHTGERPTPWPFTARAACSPSLPPRHNTSQRTPFLRQGHYLILGRHKSHTGVWANLCTKVVLSGASLVAQWLRVRLPMQGTRVRALVWEDPTCRGATRPVSHNY